MHRYAGASNLVRLAVFSFPGSFPEPRHQLQQWGFDAFAVSGAAVTRLAIAPGSAVVTQSMDTNSVHPSGRPDAVTGVRSFDAPDVCDAMMMVSAPFDLGLARDAACASGTVATSLVHNALKLENPALTPSDSVSCANCHLATTVRRVNEKSASIDSSAFMERAGAEPSSGGSAHRFYGVTRAFGYHAVAGSTLMPAVSPRTVYETRAVLARIALLDSDPSRAFAP